MDPLMMKIQIPEQDVKSFMTLWLLEDFVAVSAHFEKTEKEGFWENKQETNLSIWGYGTEGKMSSQTFVLIKEGQKIPFDISKLKFIATVRREHVAEHLFRVM